MSIEVKVPVLPESVADATVAAWHKKVGDKVKAGDGVLVIEAMKMENEIQASTTGTVVAVHVTKGDAVTPDESLLEVQPE